MEDDQQRNGRFQDDLEVTGEREIQPSPEILEAVKQNYPIEASIADLVDNSIDAEARTVLVRFVREREKLYRLCVADDGKGMSEQVIDRAMQFAGRREYEPRALGMFGLGLKSASLSQADRVSVLSRARGSRPVGRQWTDYGIRKKHWKCNELSAASVSTQLRRGWGRLRSIKIGTVVQWDAVHDFDRLTDGVDAYIEHVKLKIQRHLGLKLHRFLERRRLKLVIDVYDSSTGESGPESTVEAMNPFPPASNGARGYPKIFVAMIPARGRLRMRAHIWPKKSADLGYRLGGGSVQDRQGFYFYRHDRLIQDGGWNGIVSTNEPHLSLARVEVDIPDELGDYLKVRSNKAGVDTPASFSDAVRKAQARDGTVFSSYLEKAREVYRYRTK